MADLKILTPVEDTYLENTTSRSAFYHVKVFEVGSRYEVGVTWGKIGTTGTTRSQGRFNSISSARSKMNQLADAKLKKAYAKAKIRGKATLKTTASKKRGRVVTQPLSLSRFSQILE